MHRLLLRPLPAGGVIRGPMHRTGRQRRQRIRGRGVRSYVRGHVPTASVATTIAAATNATSATHAAIANAAAACAVYGL